MITSEQLAQWRAACEKAMPLPWVGDPAWGIVGVCDYIPDSSKRDFIIAASVALPALLNEVERLRAQEAAILDRVAVAIMDNEPIADSELVVAMNAALEKRNIKAGVQIVHPSRRIVITIPQDQDHSRAVELAIYDAELDLIEAGLADVAFDLELGV